MSEPVGAVGQVVTLNFGRNSDGSLETKTAKVVGTFYPKSYSLQNGTDILDWAPDIFVPSAAKDVFFATDFYVIAESPQTLQIDKAQWIGLLNEELSRLGVRGVMHIQTMNDWRDDFLRSRRDMITLSLWLTAIIIAIATFGYGSINAVSVWDRSMEIGTYYATGATRWRVSLILLLEMVVPLLVPAILSIALGLARLTFNVVVIDWLVVLETVAMITLVGFLSTLGPFLTMWRVSPSKLIRGENR